MWVLLSFIPSFVQKAVLCIVHRFLFKNCDKPSKVSASSYKNGKALAKFFYNHKVNGLALVL